LGKILVNDIQFAKFAKFLPARILRYTVSLTAILRYVSDCYASYLLTMPSKFISLLSIYKFRGEGFSFLDLTFNHQHTAITYNRHDYNAEQKENKLVNGLG